MTNLTTRVKQWGPPVAAVCSVILATGYVLGRQNRAANDISTLRRLGKELTDAAAHAQTGLLSADQAQALKAEKQDIEQRMEEAFKPGMVQAELMASARTAGLDVREVQPTGSSSPTSGKGVTTFPCYRVSVEGEYARIAEYMQICKSQRVPARATGFRVAPVLDKSGKQTKTLRAEITMETFLPRSLDKAGEGGA